MKWNDAFVNNAIPSTSSCILNDDEVISNGKSEHGDNKFEWENSFDEMRNCYLNRTWEDDITEEIVLMILNITDDIEVTMDTNFTNNIYINWEAGDVWYKSFDYVFKNDYVKNIKKCKKICYFLEYVRKLRYTISKFDFEYW